MKTRLFVFSAVLIALLGLSGHVFAQDDPPPPPLPTHLTPPGPGTPSAAAPPVVNVSDVTPPPPLPTHFTPTSNTHPTITSRPTITAVRILHRVDGSFKATRSLVRGESARFLVSFKVDKGSAGNATALLLITKNGKEIYARSMKKASMGVTNGSFRSDVRLASKNAMGRLSAFFRVTLGRSAQRAVPFTVQSKPKTKR